MNRSFVYVWGNNQRRAQLKGRVCELLVTSRMNSCLVEFGNGDRVVTSRRALRPATKRDLLDELTLFSAELPGGYR